VAITSSGLLDARAKRHQQLPAPDTEFVLYSVARLLGSIATAIERHEAIPESVRDDAEPSYGLPPRSLIRASRFNP
jgi:hypothetical protein